jgi:hypothetical protein
MQIAENKNGKISLCPEISFVPIYLENNDSWADQAY